jgi:peptidoglycan hydrolase FlgJ
MHIPAGTGQLPEQPARETHLRAKSQELEAAFLTEMLSHAGLGKARESFGGGVGEDQFSSFLRTEQVNAIIDRGGIGLSEHFFQSLMERSVDAK